MFFLVYLFIYLFIYLLVGVMERKNTILNLKYLLSDCILFTLEE